MISTRTSMQVQRNLSGNYYTESLMSSSLIRDDKALRSLAKISCTRKKNWFTVYFLNRGFKTHTFLCGSPSSLPVILKASRHKTTGYVEDWLNQFSSINSLEFSQKL